MKKERRFGVDSGKSFKLVTPQVGKYLVTQSGPRKGLPTVFADE